GPYASPYPVPSVSGASAGGRTLFTRRNPIGGNRIGDVRKKRAARTAAACDTAARLPPESHRLRRRGHSGGERTAPRDPRRGDCRRASVPAPFLGAFPALVGRRRDSALFARKAIHILTSPQAEFLLMAALRRSSTTTSAAPLTDRAW